MPTSNLILVIDDDDYVRSAICDNLKDWGYDTIEAGNGEKGLSFFEKFFLPAIVITDILMPDMEGLETIIKIRKGHPTVKVIAMSGGGATRTSNFLEMAEKLGADAIFTKPINMDKLETVVRNLAAFK